MKKNKTPFHYVQQKIFATFEKRIIFCNRSVEIRSASFVSCKRTHTSVRLVSNKGDKQFFLESR